MPHELDPRSMFPETADFWKAASDNRLLVKRCESCREAHFYPRVHCPFCHSALTQWEEVSGAGTIYSFAVQRSLSPARATAVIDIGNEIRLQSAIVDTDLGKLRIGQEVRFAPIQGGLAPELAFTTSSSLSAKDYAGRVIAAASVWPSLPSADAAEFERAAIVGAGTMGVGIAQAFANAGIPVTLIDRDTSVLEGGLSRLKDQYERSLKQKRMTQSQFAERMALVSTSTDFAEIGRADVVVEAVWEQLGLKREVFGLIQQYARSGALLGTNTSALDVNEIAAATKRPEDVLGLHFFTPAQTMPLLEIVRGHRTSPRSVARAIALAVKLRKTPVVVEVAPGFVGNRMFAAREREARRMLLEGSTPQQVDRVLVRFGMPMGSFEIADMTSGVELGYRRRQETGEVDPLGDAMFRAGRVGQKVGKGFYKYKPESRKPEPDPAVLAMVESLAQEAGITRRIVTDEEIEERLLLIQLHEGFKLLQEGVTSRPGDIDAVWLQGYGWPIWRGGPLYYAEELGLDRIHDRLNVLAQSVGERYKPCELLVRLVRERSSINDAFPS